MGELKVAYTGQLFTGITAIMDDCTLKVHSAYAIIHDNKFVCTDSVIICVSNLKAWFDDETNKRGHHDIGKLLNGKVLNIEFLQLMASHKYFKEFDETGVTLYNKNDKVMYKVNYSGTYEHETRSYNTADEARTWYNYEAITLNLKPHDTPPKQFGMYHDNYARIAKIMGKKKNDTLTIDFVTHSNRTHTSVRDKYNENFWFMVNEVSVHQYTIVDIPEDEKK